jgi:hypothetical protein
MRYAGKPRMTRRATAVDASPGHTLCGWRRTETNSFESGPDLSALECDPEQLWESFDLIASVSVGRCRWGA